MNKATEMPMKQVDELMQHQEEMERVFSNNQLISRIRAEFTECTQFDFKGYFAAKGINERFGFDILVQMALHKRAPLPTLVGLLRHHAASSQECVDMIQKAAEADLLDWDPQIEIFIVKFTISQDVQDEIDKFQYPLPMVVMPKELKGNLDSGYLLAKGSVILRDNHHDDDVCLDHLNRMNKVKLTINLDTARLVKNQWRRLDKRAEGETKEDFQRRVKAFEKFDRTAKDVMQFLMKESTHFYLTHKYDKRGRIYCQGYHVSYQGTPWCKAVIEFAEEEIVNG